MVEIYLDGADFETMAPYATDPLISGFTTNPSLLRKAGVKNYREFAKKVLEIIPEKPVSFEVLADDFPTMEKQAQQISDWGENVYVKIPIMNSKGESSIDLIDRLQDLRLNITAVMTHQQIEELSTVVWSHHIVSVFAGRITDADGAIPFFPQGFKAKKLWASTREIANINTATLFGYDIITLTSDLVAKLPLRGKDLRQYSLETVQQFFNDAKGIQF